METASSFNAKLMNTLPKATSPMMTAVSIGAVIYYIVLQIVLQLGLNTNDLKLVSALIVAVFLAIPYWKGHIHTKKGGSVHA